MNMIPLGVSAPGAGARDGATIIALDRAPTGRDGRIGDFALDRAGLKLYGPKTTSGWAVALDIRGPAGWTPRFALTADGARRVMTVTWTGGVGAPPASGYLGATGVVAALADALDLRGVAGPQAMIDALPAGSDLSYASRVAAATPGDENRQFALIDFSRPGHSVTLWRADDLAGLAVPGDIRRAVIGSGDGERVCHGLAFERVDGEPDVDARLKRRSLDRHRTDGVVDLALGGWWVYAPAVADLAHMDIAEGEDIGPVVQALHDFLAARPWLPARVRIPVGQWYIDTQIVISDLPLTLAGDGATYDPNETSASIVWQRSTALSPIKFTGTASRGGGVDGVTFKQVHPAVGPGWAPTVYPPTINIRDTYGEVFVTNCVPLGIYHFVDCYNSGRTEVLECHGQTFRHFVVVDLALDVVRIKGAHHLGYWSSDNSVRTWTQANLDWIEFGRADTPVIDDAFALGAHSALHLVTTANGAATKVHFGALRADFCKYGIWSQAAGVTVLGDNFDHQGQGAPSSGAPVAGARALKLEGAENRILIANMQTQRADTCTIELDATATATRVRIGNAALYWYDMAGPGGGAVKIAAGAGAAGVWFGTAPVLNPSNAGPLYYPGTTVQANVQANVAGLDGLYVSWGDGTGSLNALGASADIDIAVNPKGGGQLTTPRPIKPGVFTVASLPTVVHIGSCAYVTNMRVLTSGGTLQSAGAGTGGLATFSAAGWRVSGTNIAAQA